MERKMLPIGIDDFKEMRKKNYYFVDKSMFINELLGTGSKITLMPRPRRFGKTLNMSMLKYFFDIKGTEENRKLFEGLQIENTKWMGYQGKYPVIYLTLKDIKVSNWEDCLSKIESLIVKLYTDNAEVKESLSGDSLEYFEKIISRKASKIYLSESLENLSKYMRDYYGEKVIVLIDEYDAPLTMAYTKGYYEEAIEFFRNFLSGAFKSNENLEFGVLTGIMRIAKESIFSGFNNPDVVTILSDRYNWFGFKEKEVEELVKHYGLEYELEEVKKWYNGYRFGETQIYNPWSIINFAQNNSLKSYWVNTSSNDLIQDILKERDMEIYEDLKKLFAGESIPKYITEDVIFTGLKNLSTVWSLLFFSGYLTTAGEKISVATGKIMQNLIIPNDEVRGFFEDTFIERYSHGEPDKYYSMVDELYFGNIEEFSRELKGNYKSSVSYHDNPLEESEKEKYYHHFMLGMLLTLQKKYDITSNRESGLGRYDVAMFPKEEGQHGLIFEFKVADSKDKLKEKSEKALEQIKEKEYETYMRSRGVEKIIRIGVAFYKKDIEVSWECQS